MAILHDLKAMDPRKVDDAEDGELDFWLLKKSARIDVPLTDLEHVKTVVMREIEDLLDNMRRIVRDDQEKVAIRLYRVGQRVRFCHSGIQLPKRRDTKSSSDT